MNSLNFDYVLKIHIKYLGIITGILLTVMLILLAPIQGWAQPPIPKSVILPVSNCSIDSNMQPPLPLKMNSVVVFRGVVKTIFLEKEVFKCQHQTKKFPIILDVNTYRDIIEDTSRTNATAKQSTFEIISCAKTLDGNISGCASKEPPRDLPGLLNCSNSEQSASTLPIEMNTVIANGRVKTIEAEKEIFNCLLASNNVPVIKEVTLFIEKFESFDGPTLYNKTNSFEYSTCIKNVSNATVLGCNSQAIK